MLKKWRELLDNNEVRVLVFAVVLVLFNWPFVSVMGRYLQDTFFYLFLAWAALIAYLFLASREKESPPPASPDTETREDPDHV